MLLQRLFCIFGQGLSRRQIVPSVKENEDQTDTSTRLLIKSFKKKFSGEAASWNAAMIERDAISLSDIIRTEEHEAMYKVFADPTRIVILSFRRADCQQPSGGRGKNPLVLSQLHILAGKTLARETVKESNSSDLKVLVDVIAGFADFLLKLERKCHRQQEKKIRTQLSTTQQSSLSHESCVALTNLLLFAMYDHIAASKSGSTTPMCQGFYSCFERLCFSLKALCISTPSNCTNKTKALLHQCIAIASKTIPVMGVFYASNIIVMPTDTQIRYLASSLQCLAFSLIAVRKLCGDESYGASMLYWSACDALPCIIDMAATSAKAQASTHSRTSASMTFQALALTCPTPQELEEEIRRLQRVRTHAPDTLASEDTTILSAMMGDGTDGRRASKGGQGREAEGRSGLAFSPRAVDDFNRDFCPVRVRYLLEGLQRALRAGILDTGDSTSIMRLREEWLTCFARTLLFVLDQLPHPFACLNPSSLSSKCLPGFPVSLVEFAPVLAEMFLEISMSFDFSSTREHDWIYTELTKRLALFVDRLKHKRKSSQKQMMRKRPSLPLKGSADMTPTPSAASVLRDIQASYGEGQLVLPLWQMKPPSVHMIDDAVDGNFKLSNGTSRWYPGRITAVNGDGTYALTYLDGDVHLNKDASEIRQTKNCKLSSSRSSRSGISSVEGGGSLRDSFITVNSDAPTQPMGLTSPFKSSHSRKKSMPTNTPRLLGVEEHSESCSPPIVHVESRNDDSITLLVSGVVSSLAPIAEATCTSDGVSPPILFSAKEIEIDKDKEGLDSARSTFSDISVQSADSNQSCQQTFAIPSVFDTPRQELKLEALPKMQLGNLESSSATSHCSGMSLSAFLCRDNGDSLPDDGEGDDDQDEGRGSSKPPSPRYWNSEWLIHSPSGMGASAFRLKGSVKDYPLPQNPYSASHSYVGGGPGLKATPSIGPSDTPSAGSSELLLSYTLSASPPSYSYRKGGGTHINLRQQKGGSLSSSGIADRGKDTAQSSNPDDVSYTTSMRTFSIVSALLIQHCVVGKGNFLDISSCSTSDPEAVHGSFRERSADRIGTKEDPVRRLSLPNASLPPLGNEFSSWKQEKQINILFSVREFLEKITDSERRRTVPFLTEISNFSMGASMRVLKLVTPSMFNSCLPSHMNRAKKIGDGGFGAVFRVTCDGSCSKCGSWETFRCRHSHPHNYVLSSRRGSTGDVTVTDTGASQVQAALGLGVGAVSVSEANRQLRSTLSSLVRKDSGCSSSPTRTTYAVKRIPRERSMHDNPHIYEVFNEITCLQMLSGNRGVCELIDFGVHGMEYWIVLEAGKMDLRAWRLNMKCERSATRASSRSLDGSASMLSQQRKSIRASPRSLVNEEGKQEGENECSAVDDQISKEFADNEADWRGHTYSLTAHNVAMCLALFADALLIVQSVHAAHVLHFDIKCNNFILHSEPNLASIRLAHSKGVPSGFLFLADFGESVPSILSCSPSGDASKAGEVCPTHRSIPGRGPSSLSRSRGTLPIQSPEMLSLTATAGGRPSFTSVSTRRKSITRINYDSSARSVAESDSSADPSLGAPSRKAFPPPSAMSDVWSLGCLLVELVTGDYLMKDRPWTDLYVSLCMTNFRFPTLVDFKRSLTSAHLSPVYSSALEAIVGKCLMQHPFSRAPISELYEDVTALLGVTHDTECSVDPVSAISEQPSVVFAPPLDGQNANTQMAWKVIKWNSSVTRLRPRSLNFTGGCGVIIALLRPGESYTNDYLPSEHAGFYVRGEEDATQHLSSYSGCKPHLFTSYPYVNMGLPNTSATFSTQSHSGDDLRRRLDAVGDRIAGCNLASCARGLALKSVTVSARTNGLLHIQISCCSYRQYRQSESKAYSKEAIGGVEQIVIPYIGSSSGSSTSRSHFEGNDRFCDEEIMRSIRNVMRRARVALSSETPPSVLITVVPHPCYASGEEVQEEKEDSGARLSHEQQNEVSRRFEEAIRKNSSQNSRNLLDNVTNCALKDKDKEKGREREREREREDEHSEEEDPQYPLFTYTCVSLTLASVIANALTDHALAVDHSRYQSGSGIDTPLSPSSPVKMATERSKSKLSTSIDKNRQNNNSKPKSFQSPLAQRVVATWLRKSLHTDFKVFFSQQLNIPSDVAPAFKRVK